MNDFINITNSALEFFKNAISAGQYKGIRIDIEHGGCRGLSYKIDYVTEEDPADICLEQSGLTVYCAPRAMMFIAGMTMDYQVTPMGGSVVFSNPNATATCGCGKSFCSSSGEGNESPCSSCMG